MCKYCKEANHLGLEASILNKVPWEELSEGGAVAERVKGGSGAHMQMSGGRAPRLRDKDGMSKA